MQKVSLERFALGWFEHGVMLIQLDDSKRSLEISSKFSVFVQKIVNTHQHFLINFEVVNIGMFVVGPFLD